MKPWSVLLMMTIVGSACGSDEPPAPVEEPDVVEVVEDVIEEVVDVAEVEEDLYVPPPPMGWPACEGEGAPGCACDEPEDCDSGHCVLAAAGYVCSRTCDEGCPPGWACVETEVEVPRDVEGEEPREGAPVGTETLGLCQDLYRSQCRPCDNADDCLMDDGDKGTCVALGEDDGRVCHLPCTEDERCPDGYVCASGLCAPDEGAACGCNGASRLQEAATQCVLVNEHGTCAGERICDDVELGQCEVTDLDMEQCNGTDDDCDGDIDEGFSDIDIDGIPDCMDDDEDGDGIPDEEDVCPSVPNPGQEDLDGDGIGDICDPDDDGDFVPDASDCYPTDPGSACTTYYFDGDKDGVGMCFEKQCLCEPVGSYTVETCTLNDCDDKDPTKGFGLPDPCDEIDNDCDGETDEDFPEQCPPDSDD